MLTKTRCLERLRMEVGTPDQGSSMGDANGTLTPLLGKLFSKPAGGFRASFITEAENTDSPGIWGAPTPLQLLLQGCWESLQSWPSGEVAESMRNTNSDIPGESWNFLGWQNMLPGRFPSPHLFPESLLMPRSLCTRVPLVS